MRHTYDCPLRWADMDMLGHVNNVTYVDYLQEARVDFFRVHRGFAGRHSGQEAVLVVRTEIDFVAPLVFRREPVHVDTWVSQVRRASFTMDYEIWSPGEQEGERIVHARASTVLAPYVFGESRPRRLTDEERAFLDPFLEPVEPRRALPSTGTPQHVYDATVRFSDLDIFGHVNNVQFFELFQEARIAYLMGVHRNGETWGHHVVARTDVDYRRQLDLRGRPYEVHSWIAHVGTKSFTIASELRDGEDVIANCHVVMVSFDAESQRSTSMPPDQHAALQREYDAAH